MLSHLKSSGLIIWVLEGIVQETEDTGMPSVP